MNLQFEWDDRKAQANFRKHGIGFSEALSVFVDPFSITVDDPDHSVNEDRFVDIGISDRGRPLVVVYTERGTRIRLISCRRATSNERQLYEQREK